MNPRAEKVLKAIRELPMTDVRDLFNNLKYADEWVVTDATGNRTGGPEAAYARLSCIREQVSDSPVLIHKHENRWVVDVYNKNIGSAGDLRTAQSMAESELELMGYFLPWRKH